MYSDCVRYLVDLYRLLSCERDICTVTELVAAVLAPGVALAVCLNCQSVRITCSGEDYVIIGNAYLVCDSLGRVPLVRLTVVAGSREARAARVNLRSLGRVL